MHQLSPRRGFTLIEVLVVVVILGILAAIVVPQFLTAADSSRLSALKTDLHRMRTQIEIYFEQHEFYPTLVDFEASLTEASDVLGNTAPDGTPGFPFGPYIHAIPVNPYTGNDTIGDGAVASSDWYYDETTGEFLANDSADHRAY